MDIVSRLKQFMDRHDLTSSQFADTAGIPRPTLSQLLNGRNKSNEGAKKVSSDIIRKIHDAYPTLNVLWLMFGDGDMESDSNIESSEAQKPLIFTEPTLQVQDNQDIQRHIDFEDEVSDFGTDNFKEVNSPFSARNLSDRPNLASQSYTNSTPQMTVQPDRTKKVQSIMVFYDDNSFEIFKPA